MPILYKNVRNKLFEYVGKRIPSAVPPIVMHQEPLHTASSYHSTTKHMSRYALETPIPPADLMALRPWLLSPAGLGNRPLHPLVYAV